MHRALAATAKVVVTGAAIALCLGACSLVSAPSASASAAASATTAFEAEVPIGQRVTGTCVPYRSDPGTDGQPPPGYHDFFEETWTVFTLGGDESTGGWIGQTRSAFQAPCQDSPDPIVLSEPGRYWATTHHQMSECWWDWADGTPPEGENAKTYGCWQQPGGTGGLDQGTLDVDETTVNYYVVRDWKTEADREHFRTAMKRVNKMKDWAGACATASGLAAKHFPPAALGTAVCGGFGLGVLIGRELEEWLWQDPPDHDYTHVAEPAKVTPPRLRAGRGISTRQARAINAYVTKALELRSYQEAFITSYERWAGVDSGATDAVLWWNRQEAAADRYAAAAADRLDNLAGLRTKVIRVLGTSAKLKLTDKLVNQARERARRGGLPANVVKVLRTLGLGAGELGELRDAARQASPRKLPDTLAQILSDKRLGADEHDLAVKLRAFPG